MFRKNKTIVTVGTVLSFIFLFSGCGSKTIINDSNVVTPQAINEKQTMTDTNKTTFVIFGNTIKILGSWSVNYKNFNEVTLEQPTNQNNCPPGAPDCSSTRTLDITPIIGAGCTMDNLKKYTQSVWSNKNLPTQKLPHTTATTSQVPVLEWSVPGLGGGDESWCAVLTKNTSLTFSGTGINFTDHVLPIINQLSSSTSQQFEDNNKLVGMKSSCFQPQGVNFDTATDKTNSWAIALPKDWKMKRIDSVYELQSPNDITEPSGIRFHQIIGKEAVQRYLNDLEINATELKIQHMNIDGRDILTFVDYGESSGEVYIVETNNIIGQFSTMYSAEQNLPIIKSIVASFGEICK